MKLTIFLAVIPYFGCFLKLIHSIKLTDDTEISFGAKYTGVPAAFGDFDGNNYIDIFVIDDEGQSLYVLLAQKEAKYVRRNLTSEDKDSSNIIAGVQPGDFNGDLVMDLLLIKENKEDRTKPVTAQVYWGNNYGVEQGTGEKYFSEKFATHPFLLDYNADLLPDIMGENEQRKRVLFLAESNGNFTEIDLKKPGNESDFLVPHCNAFLDLDGDLAADLFLATEGGYEIWINQKGELKYNHTVPLMKTEDGNRYNIQGQVSFGDFDNDGVEDMIVPVCKEDSCLENVIYIHTPQANTTDDWIPVMKPVAGTDWHFVTRADSYEKNFPPTLYTGDFNMDGFSDFITILKNDALGITRAFLMENIPCASELCSKFGRTFQAVENPVLSSFNDVVIGTFFDIAENGNLGIVMANVDNDDQKPYMKALRQTATEDACFVRVMVVSGVCGKTCVDSQKTPHGVNQPGAAVLYQTTSGEGETQRSCGTQLSQSAYFALQLPFVQLGLGLTPNFVDQVQVGMPVNKTTYKKYDSPLMKTWTQIIPNSQLVVIPHPYSEAYRWILKLFVTPSNSVYLTGASLGGTMVFMAAIAGILQWRERREDMKEKRQDAHKFHFDAM